MQPCIRELFLWVQTNPTCPTGRYSIEWVHPQGLQNIKNVMRSVEEAEIGTFYINALELLPIRVCAEEMGHPKVPTPLQVDNTTALGFANKNIKQKMSKAIDMRLYWIQDRKDQGQFTIYWSPVKTTLLVITANIILLLITQ